eukprot:40532-Pelagomonas_calceolata.AAC.3
MSQMNYTVQGAPVEAVKVGALAVVLLACSEDLLPHLDKLIEAACAYPSSQFHCMNQAPKFACLRCVKPWSAEHAQFKRYDIVTSRQVSAWCCPTRGYDVRFSGSKVVYRCKHVAAISQGVSMEQWRLFAFPFRTS